MSPASQGCVERYIGSCLISSSLSGHKITSNKQQQESTARRRTFPGVGNERYGPGGWTGAPLMISPRRCTQQHQQQPSGEQQQSLRKNPLARLAIHTQGAPLILSSRFPARGKINNGVATCNNSGAPSRTAQRPPELTKKQQQSSKVPDCTSPAAINNIDSLSIASDESSGSNNSENSLPRIIKPRKRRKKDRKPPNGNVTPEEQQQPQQQQLNEQSSVAISKGNCYEAPVNVRNHRRQFMGRESMVYGGGPMEYGHVEVKVAENAQPPSYKQLSSNSLPRYATSCECRYCEPSPLIWDVERNCYSPFLTEFCPKTPLFLSQLNSREQRLFNADNCAGQSSNVVLRRSWSDPTSYYSEEISNAPSKDVGVIGDKWQGEGGKIRTLWRGDSIGVPMSNVGSFETNDVNSPLRSAKGLEVSTEIITSPNGHRDLEIKFYSPLNVATAQEENRSVLPEDIEDEDFREIWSYHESKLQQDFRTLLQAEE